jgi:hypothetical protein
MNAELAKLDRRLARRGETIYLRRTVGTTNQSYVQCELKAIVRALTVEQLIGNITQQNYFVIISQTGHHQGAMAGRQDAERRFIRWHHRAERLSPAKHD